MNTHPYLRAYMAGVMVPSIFLLVVLTAFIVTRIVLRVPVPIERVIIFPMAVVPNLFGVWNMLYVALRTHRHLPIGFHGALLPLIMAVNATGVFFGIKHAIPAMIANGGGSIVNLSSIAGIIGSEHVHVAYNASKAAVRLMTKWVAVQHGKDNIRANSVHPGIMPPMRTSGRTADPAVRAERMRFIPMRSAGEVDGPGDAVELSAGELRVQVPVTLRVPDQFSDGSQTQLGHDSRAMRLGGFNADVERRRDFLIGLPLGQQLNDFPFARGKGQAGSILRLLDPRSTTPLVQDHIGNLRSEVRLVAPQGIHRGDQVAAGVRFQHIPSGSRVQDLSSQLFGFMHRENQDFHRREFLQDLAGGLEAVQVGHGDIHDDQIRLVAPRPFHRLPSGERLAHNFPIGLSVEDRPQPLPHDFVIVGDQNAIGHLLQGSTGNTARTVVPGSAGPMSS